MAWWSAGEQFRRAEVDGWVVWIENDREYIFGFDHPNPWRVPRQGPDFVYPHPAPEMEALASLPAALAWLDHDDAILPQPTDVTHLGRLAWQFTVTRHHRDLGEETITLLIDQQTRHVLVTRCAGEERQVHVETTDFQVIRFERTPFVYEGMTRDYDGHLVVDMNFQRLPVVPPVVVRGDIS